MGGHAWAGREGKVLLLHPAHSVYVLSALSRAQEPRARRLSQPVLFYWSECWREETLPWEGSWLSSHCDACLCICALLLIPECAGREILSVFQEKLCGMCKEEGKGAGFQTQFSELLSPHQDLCTK